MVAFEIIFLLTLALVWIVFATVQDIRHREVANWLNFSLIIFALAFRLFYSIFESGDYYFIIQGFIGLGIFFVLGHVFYYARFFAGGDAKLLIALGAILPISESFGTNLSIFVVFILLLLLIGSVYGFIYGTSLAIIYRRKFSKELRKQVLKSKKLFYISIIFSILWLLFMLLLGETYFYIISLLFLLIPVLFVYAKAIENSCMIKSVSIEHLREGDWLYSDLSVEKRKIKSKWEGLSRNDIELIRDKLKGKKIHIKQGMPFVPVFLISFIIFIFLYLRYPLWEFYTILF